MADALDAALAAGDSGGGMVPAEEHKLEDSNVENIGSAEDKAARLAAAQTEEEWTGAGQEVGLEIWRVENVRTKDDKPDFGVKRWPKDEYGKFFKGDSYILLNTYKKDPDEAKLSFDVHFWIGEESTQDEYGVAAYKTVELDDLLGGDPVQYRETMGHESELFLSYFPNGLIIESGGIESGFRHVTPEQYKPHLFQVQRRDKQVRAFEVELIAASLDKTDCFILDAGNKIYVYHGAGSDGFEKNKSTALAETMEAEREGRSERVDVDDGFWKLLGCTEADISSGESKAHKPLEFTTPKLYSMHDDTHEWVLVKEGAMSAEDIKNDDVMMLNVGSEIFVCVGNDAPGGEKKDAMIKAQNFLVANDDLPNFTPLHRVKTGQNPNKDSWTRAFDATACAAEPEPAAPTPTAEEGEAPAPAAEPAPAPAPAGDGSMYSLAELQAGCPAGVVANSKEKSLNDADFEATFKMTRDEFDAVPKWKRDKAKKDAGIF